MFCNGDDKSLFNDTTDFSFWHRNRRYIIQEFIRDGFNTGLAQHNITPQTPLRQQGFGGHFKDAPPPYIKEEDEENKI